VNLQGIRDRSASARITNNVDALERMFGVLDALGEVSPF
jgi:hypothetical protein